LTTACFDCQPFPFHRIALEVTFAGLTEAIKNIFGALSRWLSPNHFCGAAQDLLVIFLSTRVVGVGSCCQRQYTREEYNKVFGGHAVDKQGELNAFVGDCCVVSLVNR
jgi:hypothetical protein